MASGTFQPLGRVSKARRSELLLFLTSVPLGASLLFFGRPRSMILPVMLLLSDTFRRWLPVLEPDRESLKPDDELSDGVSRVGIKCSSLTGLGDPRWSSGLADTGVGKVDVVTDEYTVEADPGVVADSGVTIPLDLGESSGRADRGVSLLLLPDLRRLNDNCLFKGERLDICVGIMSGGRSLGDNGGRVLGGTLDSVSFVEGLDE